jgi:hypothetical protein
MMTLTAPAPRTLKTSAIRTPRPEARTKPAAGPGFWTTLLRALSAAAV